MRWSSVKLQESDTRLLKQLLDTINMKTNSSNIPIEVSLAELAEVRDMDILAEQLQAQSSVAVQEKM